MDQDFQHIFTRGTRWAVLIIALFILGGGLAYTILSLSGLTQGDMSIFVALLLGPVIGSGLFWAFWKIRRPNLEG